MASVFCGIWQPCHFIKDHQSSPLGNYKKRRVHWFFQYMIQNSIIVNSCSIFLKSSRSSLVAWWVKDLTLSLLWLSGLRTQRCRCEVSGSIPGLARWVKDPELPQAVVQLADVAPILSCCGCGVGRQLQLQFDPQPGNLHMPMGAALKRWVLPILSALDNYLK